MDKDELIKWQAAVIEQMREAVETFLKQYPHMAKGYLIDALDLQPCPEVLNKVRADAVTAFGNWIIVRSVGATNIPMSTGTIRSMSEDYARRIEKGEV